MNQLKIALAQINPSVGDIRGNADKILQFYKKAAEAKCDLVVFPECSLVGYPAEDLIFRKSFVNDNLFHLKQLSKKISKPFAVVGYIRQKGNLKYNACALLGNSKIVAHYCKHALPNYGVFDEKRYFAPGKELGMMKINGIPIGISICEDLWDEKEHLVYRKQARAGAKVLINISASPYDFGKFQQRIALLKKRIRQTQCPILYLNLVGGQDELIFDGRSLVIDKRGKIVLQSSAFNEDLAIVRFEFKNSNLQKIIAEEWPAQIRQSPSSNIEEIYQALALGTRDYVEKNGFKSVLIGLSGGIDSALTGAVAVDALGKERVQTVTMPSRYSSQETLEDAMRLAKNLGTKLITMPIEPIFKSYLETLTPHFKGYSPDITEENLQSRIRGTLLMALSNKFGALVLTTGNKSEVSVGYSTLYGDTAGGFSVLKDVPKTIVYKLSHYVNQKSGKELIPQSTILRAPSAELKENQKDQDTLPPYDLLDQIIQYYVEDDLGAQELAKMGFDAQTVSKVARMIDSNEYKRRQSPPGIKISYKSFGKDRRMPITNRFKESLLIS